MGARAVLRIYSDDHDGAFWGAWASPEFVMAGLARWIEACRWRNQIPSAANYWEHVQVDPGSQFTDAIGIDEPYPSDLNFRYELRVVTTLYGWAGDLSVRSNLPSDGGTGDRYNLRHSLSVSSLLMSEIHAVAASGLRSLAERANSTPGRGGYPPEAVEHWSRQADMHEAYAGVGVVKA